jgi:hypothetical protein
MYKQADEIWRRRWFKLAQALKRGPNVQERTVLARAKEHGAEDSAAKFSYRRACGGDGVVRTSLQSGTFHC